MPSLTYTQPCDGEELIGAWQVAVESRSNPSTLSLARDPVGHVPNTDRRKVKLGAYVIIEDKDTDVTLVSCGSNLHYVVAASETWIPRA